MIECCRHRRIEYYPCVTLRVWISISIIVININQILYLNWRVFYKSCAHNSFRKATPKLSNSLIHSNLNLNQAACDQVKETDRSYRSSASLLCQSLQGEAVWMSSLQISRRVWPRDSARERNQARKHGRSIRRRVGKREEKGSVSLSKVSGPIKSRRLPRR